jgi:hypothetical protein
MEDLAALVTTIVGLPGVLCAWWQAHPVAATGVVMGLVMVEVAQDEYRQHPYMIWSSGVGRRALTGVLLIIVNLLLVSLGVL